MARQYSWASAHSCSGAHCHPFTRVWHLRGPRLVPIPAPCQQHPASAGSHPHCNTPTMPPPHTEQGCPASGCFGHCRRLLSSPLRMRGMLICPAPSLSQTVSIPCPLLPSLLLSKHAGLPVAQALMLQTIPHGAASGQDRTWAMLQELKAGSSYSIPIVRTKVLNTCCTPLQAISRSGTRVYH